MNRTNLGNGYMSIGKPREPVNFPLGIVYGFGNDRDSNEIITIAAAAGSTMVMVLKFETYARDKLWSMQRRFITTID